MSKKKPGIILLSRYAHAIAEMSTEDAGMLLKAIYAFDSGMEIPDMSPLARAMYSLIRVDIQEHAERYEQICSRNRKNAQKRWGSACDASACDRMGTYADAYQKCQEEVKGEEEGEEKISLCASTDVDVCSKAERERSNIHAMLTGPDRERFEKFWSIYPRRESRARAESAWRELHPDDDLTQTILRAVQNACVSDPRFRTQQYIPHPANWLRRHEWESEYETLSATEETPNYGSWTRD